MKISLRVTLIGTPSTLFSWCISHWFMMALTVKCTTWEERWANRGSGGLPPEKYFRATPSRYVGKRPFSRQNVVYFHHWDLCEVEITKLSTCLHWILLWRPRARMAKLHPPLFSRIITRREHILHRTYPAWAAWNPKCILCKVHPKTFGKDK